MTTTSSGSDSTELERALLTGVPARFDPFTGADLGGGPSEQGSAGQVQAGQVQAGQVSAGQGFRAAELGLEAPRFCQLCGRRMVVQVDPVGWTARCSRHGRITAEALEPAESAGALDEPGSL